MRVFVRDAWMDTFFTVKEPAGYDHADITATNRYFDCGVEMKLRVFIVEWRKEDQDASFNDDWAKPGKNWPEEP